MKKKSHWGQNGLITLKKCMSRLVLQENIRSLYRYFSKLKVFLSEPESKPVAKALTETWRNENSNENALVLDGYQKITACSRAKRHGGKGIYFKRQHDYQIIKWTTNHH